jgi:hypothetical protein
MKRLALVVCLVAVMSGIVVAQEPDLSDKATYEVVVGEAAQRFVGLIFSSEEDDNIDSERYQWYFELLNVGVRYGYFSEEDIEQVRKNVIRMFEGRERLRRLSEELSE